MRKFTLLLLSFTLAAMVSAQIKTSVLGDGSVFVNNTKEVALYDQLAPWVTAVASQQFPDFGDSRLQAADDFTVPSGPGWDVSRVEILATPSIAVPSFPDVTFIIEIYENDGGLPAAVPFAVADNLSFTESAGLYSITLNSPMYLPAGDYWISVMPNMAFGLYGQLFWGFADGTQIGNELHVQDPDGLTGGTYPPTWGAGSTVWPIYSAYNSSFAIYGEDASPSVPLNNWALIIGGMLIIGFTLVRVKMIN
ncbi:hypothetical protein HNS38_09655 [Lentimicrobium sp. L6]|uniref:hypothetical protein n=1 Tax=Lentimicrobium sp. L6 TaxID=2735916 RepID=UPI001553DA49|nr:hypothetical protein [Lentimicrobium sp. L6]NPD85023.1 hypothetical protein [Lentimicrobium sp. L6]